METTRLINSLNEHYVWNSLGWKILTQTRRFRRRAEAAEQETWAQAGFYFEWELYKIWTWNQWVLLSNWKTTLLNRVNPPQRKALFSQELRLFTNGCRLQKVKPKQKSLKLVFSRKTSRGRWWSSFCKWWSQLNSNRWLRCRCRVIDS